MTCVRRSTLLRRKEASWNLYMRALRIMKAHMNLLSDTRILIRIPASDRRIIRIYTNMM
jgi:hypothetical protein